MTEHTWNMIVVWSLVVNGVVQGVTHFMVFAAMLTQGDSTGVGWSLRWREVALGVKNIGTTSIHFLLAWIVWKGYTPLNVDQRFGIYAFCTVTIFVAVLANFHLLWSLHKELRTSHDSVVQL